MRAGTRISSCWGVPLRRNALFGQYPAAVWLAQPKAWGRATKLRQSDVPARFQQHPARPRRLCSRAAALPASQRSEDIRTAAAPKLATFRGLSGDDFRWVRCVISIDVREMACMLMQRVRPVRSGLSKPDVREAKAGCIVGDAPRTETLSDMRTGMRSKGS